MGTAEQDAYHFRWPHCIPALTPQPRCSSGVQLTAVPVPDRTQNSLARQYRLGALMRVFAVHFTAEQVREQHIKYLRFPAWEQVGDNGCCWCVLSGG